MMNESAFVDDAIKLAKALDAERRVQLREDDIETHTEVAQTVREELGRDLEFFADCFLAFADEFGAVPAAEAGTLLRGLFACDYHAGVGASSGVDGSWVVELPADAEIELVVREEVATVVARGSKRVGSGEDVMILAADAEAGEKGEVAGGDEEGEGVDSPKKDHPPQLETLDLCQFLALALAVLRRRSHPQHERLSAATQPPQPGVLPLTSGIVSSSVYGGGDME